MMYKLTAYKLTAYELFAIAIIAMLVDHVGLYFGADNLWLRVFRMFALIWFLPIGYNSGRGVGVWLWTGMLILVAANWQIGMNLLPISALGTIIAIKLTINPLMEYALRSKTVFWLVNLGLLALYPVSDMLTEYGTLALLIAMAGWLLRNKGKLPPGIVDVKEYFVLVTVIYIFEMQVGFHFSPPQFIFMAVTTAMTAVVMFNFKQLILNSLSRKKRDPIEAICRFIGHKTLEIYVGFYLVLKGLLLFALTHP